MTTQEMLDRLERAISAATMLLETTNSRAGMQQPLGTPTIELAVENCGEVVPRDTDSHALKSYNAGLTDRMVIVLESSLDQAATVQIFGSPRNNAEAAVRYDIGDPINLPAGMNASIPINLDDHWHPWIGMLVTPMVAPTSGRVLGTVHAQRRSMPEG